jgi:uncharacterized protein (TIGR02147 family)
MDIFAKYGYICISMKPDIFNYLNFREFLKDHLGYVRSRNPAFRFQTLVEKYGLHSRSHYIDILNGRKLTKKFFDVYRQIGDLSGKEADYFRALVGYDQAQNDAEKMRHFHEILRLSPNLETVKLEQEAYRYFSAWYNPVMLSVLDLNRHERDHRKIAALFKPRITAIQARQALKTLTDLQFISWDKDRNVWNIHHQFLKSTDGARAAALRSFHKEMQRIGMQTYETDFENQTFSTLTLSTSIRTRNEIERMIADLRQSIMEKAKADAGPEVVTQVNFQIFSLSKTAMKKNDNGEG